MSWWKRIFGVTEQRQHTNQTGITDNFKAPRPEASQTTSPDDSQPPFFTDDEDIDPLYEEAVNFVLVSKRASVSALQRKLQIGYNRAARMIEDMVSHGIVSMMDTNGAREVLVAEFDTQAAARARRAALDAAENDRVMRLNYLLEKYQDEETVRRIIQKTIWEGMSSAQLFDTLGEPEGIDQKYLKQVSREVWKYHSEGKNRFATRITLENGFVVGWDFKR